MESHRCRRMAEHPLTTFIAARGDGEAGGRVAQFVRTETTEVRFPGSLIPDSRAPIAQVDDITSGRGEDEIVGGLAGTGRRERVGLGPFSWTRFLGNGQVVRPSLVR